MTALFDPAAAEVDLSDKTEDRLKASVCRNDFWTFTQTMWHAAVAEKPVWNWHMRYICRRLQKAAERVFKGETKLGDICLNVPPGSSKSTIVSVLFPAWCWTRMRSMKFVCCSYSERLAQKLSLKCRDVVRSDLYRKYFPEVQIRGDQDTKLYWALEGGGERYAVGSGGAVMGVHGHSLLIDDPLDPEQVLSEIELARVNNWIEEQLSGRKVDKLVSFTVLVMQRLHQNDPAANMLRKGWCEHICIPAVSHAKVEPPFLRRYYRNGLMDPHRLPRQALDAIAAGSRGAFVLSGQYYQDPVPPGGSSFKLDKVGRAPPPKTFLSKVRMWDCAGSVGAGDWTVGALMGLDRDRRIWVLDLVRVQFDAYRREKLILRTAVRDGREVVVGQEQEGGSAGKEVVERRLRKLGTRGFRVRTVRPSGNKEVRADPFAEQMGAGNVWVPPGVPWYDVWAEELKYFPLSSHDDIVDACSHGLFLLGKAKLRVGAVRASGRGE